MLNDPELDKKISAAADKVTVKNADDGNMMNTIMKEDAQKPVNTIAMQTEKDNKYQLTQVVGIIIGSPEFQRR